MADAATPSKGGAWSEGEKYQLLLKIISQLTEGGAKINLAKLDMPGRTPKSLSHMVGRIKAEASNSATESQKGGAAPPGTPKSTGKRAGGFKARKTTKPAKDEDKDNDADHELFKKEEPDDNDDEFDQDDEDPFTTNPSSPRKKQKREV